MSERRFALVDFTHMNRAGCLRLYEAGHTYALSWAIAHAATKRELVAKQRPSGWTPPSMFRQPEVLTEAEVIEAEAELKVLQRHALEVVDPEGIFRHHGGTTGTALSLGTLTHGRDLDHEVRRLCGM